MGNAPLDASDIAIYVATHNQPIDVSERYLFPIQTGASLSTHKICELTDNTGVHISEKNREYCELTALYWIWKNTNNAIVGLSHYRRRFKIQESEITKILHEHEMIIPPPYYFRSSLWKGYKNYHLEADMESLVCILEQRCPEIVPVFRQVMDDNELIPYNMLIASKVIFDEYCQWLFPILFAVEKEIDFMVRDTYQRRVMGFLSERLFTTYVKWRNYKTYICPVDIPETSTVPRCIKYNAGKYFNKSYFRLMKQYE